MEKQKRELKLGRNVEVYFEDMSCFQFNTLKTTKTITFMYVMTSLNVRLFKNSEKIQSAIERRTHDNCPFKQSCITSYKR